MGRSQETFRKKEVREKKEKKKKEKLAKKLAKRENEKSSSLDDMIAYVDENGNITSEPPDTAKKEETKAEDIEVSVPKKAPASEQDLIRKGIVSFFNHSKGFGFLKDTETKEDIFVHINNTLEDITEGNSVTFEVEKGPKGLIAVNVKLTD